MYRRWYVSRASRVTHMNTARFSVCLCFVVADSRRSCVWERERVRIACHVHIIFSQSNVIPYTTYCFHLFFWLWADSRRSCVWERVCIAYRFHIILNQSIQRHAIYYPLFFPVFFGCRFQEILCARESECIACRFHIILNQSNVKQYITHCFFRCFFCCRF